MPSHPTKVLYILGSGRNGSTILGNILGSVSGMTHVGELHWIWDRGAGENRPCGCGERFGSCSFWQEVLGGLSDVEPTDLQERAKRRRATLEGLAPMRLLRRRSLERANPHQRTYLDVTEQLYHSISATAGIDCVVDSSKRPVYAHAILQLDGLDVYILHLVRDSRAVAFSWRRKMLNPDRPDGGYMARYPAWKSALGWAVWNAYGEVLRARYPGRYILVRYEDFVTEPALVLAAIADLTGADIAVTIEGDHQVTVSASHAISGNPRKFDTGAVQLLEDTEWADVMPRTDFWVVTILTWPLLLWYRYRLRPQK